MTSHVLKFGRFPQGIPELGGLKLRQSGFWFPSNFQCKNVLKVPYHHAEFGLSLTLHVTVGPKNVGFSDRIVLAIALYYRLCSMVSQSLDVLEMIMYPVFGTVRHTGYPDHVGH